MDEMVLMGLAGPLDVLWGFGAQMKIDVRSCGIFHGFPWLSCPAGL